MKARYRFKRLIKKYSHAPAIIKEYSEGYFDIENGNEWVDGELTEIEIEGAVTNLKPDEFELGEGGPFHNEDRKLYCYYDIDKGSTVTHKGNEYAIDSKLPYEDFDDGLILYYLRRVDRVEGNTKQYSPGG